MMLLTMTDATFVVPSRASLTFGAVKDGADDPSLRAGTFLETFITLTEKDPSMTAERLNALKEQLPKGEGDEGDDDAENHVRGRRAVKTEAFQDDPRG